jgi:hypothetical protein
MNVKNCIIFIFFGLISIELVSQKRLKTLDEVEFQKEEYYFFELSNGSKILGYYIGQHSADYIELATDIGTQIKVHKGEVKKVIKARPENMVDGNYRHENNYAHRYMFSPSAFNIKGNSVRWFNGYGFFNALEYGINDYVSLKAGLNFVHLVDNDNFEEFYYVAAKVGNIKLLDKIYFGTQIFYAEQNDNKYYNINPMLTSGNKNNNFTLGWSRFMYAGSYHFFDFSYNINDEDFFQKTNFIQINAMLRLSSSMYIITENWLTDDFNLEGYNYIGCRYARNLFGMDLGLMTSSGIRYSAEFIGLPYVTLNYKF